MRKTVVEFTAQEVDVLVRHLGGLCKLYEHVNSSGSGPLPSVLNKIKRATGAEEELEGKFI